MATVSLWPRVMCLVSVFLCPRCERMTQVRVSKAKPPLLCDNPLCCKLLDHSRSPVDKPCSPSCNSKTCGLFYQLRCCFGSCGDRLATFAWYGDPTKEPCV